MGETQPMIVEIDLNDDETEMDTDKPIMQLFKRLINNENKQSTILTNAQIVDILDKEFAMNLWEIDELEGEIYLTIMKKYLKDWPRWDKLDKITSALKSKDDNDELNRILETNYIYLKEYLKVMLDFAKTVAKPTVSKLIADMDKIRKDSKSDNVVVEIQCSRQRLNQVIFRRPNPRFNDSIFNGTNAIIPSLIKLDTLPLEAILNWWDVKICISRGSMYYYERKTLHELKHVLVNKSLMSGLSRRDNPLKTLPQEIQISRSTKPEKTPTTSIVQYLINLDVLMKENPTLVPLLQFIRKDIKLLPEKIISRSTYRRYTNKYPYIRHLYTEVKNPDISSRKYDLQLEETISPIYRTFLGRANLTNGTIVVECCPCGRKFTGPELITELKEHFEELHAQEPDWKCTNCEKTFSMAMLASTWWTHKC